MKGKGRRGSGPPMETGSIASAPFFRGECRLDLQVCDAELARALPVVSRHPSARESLRDGRVIHQAREGRPETRGIPPQMNTEQ